MKKACLILVLVLVISSISVWSETEIYRKNQLKLLAVQDTGNNYIGSTADLYLELRPGSGRVFLETYPLTKMDTQISTRFAQEIACSYFEMDCSQYDFVYTIKAKSNIIGGPSAGAAIAALTAITVLDLKYNPEITVTGTINSGGLIGPVGGVQEKIKAASDTGLKTVLIARGSGQFKEKNITFNLTNLTTSELNINLKEIGDLNEVVFALTGRKLKIADFVLNVSPEYQEKMKELSLLLCNRTIMLEEELSNFKINRSEREKIEEEKNNSLISLKKEDYYSAASFCFRANILVKKQIHQQDALSPAAIKQELDKVRQKVELMEKKVGSEKIETISDLQTMMIVKERLNEVKNLISHSNQSTDLIYLLAYSEERFFSALSWTHFFKMKGQKFVLDQNQLKRSCQEKLSESEERYQYVELMFYGFDLGTIKAKINDANKRLEEEDYSLCLIQAVQAKAESNALLNSVGLTESSFGSYLESQKSAVGRVIAENSAKGRFPILGYSYYQYAGSLQGGERHSALLYLEYALEMSDLSIYFQQEKKLNSSGNNILKLWVVRNKVWLSLGNGFLLGAGISALIIYGKNWIFPAKKKNKRKK